MNKNSADPFKGGLFAVLSALSYGSLGLFIRGLESAGLSLWAMLAWRFGLSALAVTGFVALTRPNALRMGRRMALKALALGAIGCGGQSSLYFLAMSELKTGLASILLYTNPVIVCLLKAALTRTRPTPLDLLAAFTTICGCVLILDFTDASLSLFGVICGLGSSVWYGCFILASEKAMQNERANSYGVTAYLFIGAGVVFTLFHLATSTDSFYLTAEAAGSLAGMVAVSTIVAVLAFFAAVRNLDSNRVATIACLEPVVTVIFGVILLNEKLNLRQSLGVAIVLATVVAVQMRPIFEVRSARLRERNTAS